MKRIFFLITLVSLSGWAERKCTFQGKEFDIYNAPNRETFTGTVKCKNTFSHETSDEEQVYKNGRLIEEKIDGAERKQVRRFYPDHPNQWQHGEQLEYFPKTNKIRRKENYEKMHKIGLQEAFHENGKIAERQFYVRESEEQGSSEAASIGYLENGDVEYLRCSKDKKTTIDLKLCGFEGKTQTHTKAESGEIRRSVTYLNGELIEEEIPVESFPTKGNILFEGYLKDAKAKTVKINHTGKNKKYTYLYANGKSKREFSSNEDGKVDGKDTEYFQSGQIARKTEFKKGEAQSGECWWENGKPRAQYQKTNEGLNANLTWDTGTENYKGSYVLNKRFAQLSNALLNTMLGCGQPAYAFERQGAFLELSREGFKVAEGSFEKGDPTGWHKLYDKKGLLAEEVLYDPSQKPNFISEKKTYEDGKLTKHEKYNSDGSIKN